MRVNTGLALAMLAAALTAQEYRGTFSGSVTDPQGAAIPKATVIVTETRTGTKTRPTSEATGEYTIPFLPPRDYRITAEPPGFTRSVLEGLHATSFGPPP